MAGALATAAFLSAVTAGPAAAQQGNAPLPARPNVAPPLILSTPAFRDGGAIPLKYTCAASTPPPGGPMNISLGVSPLLRWSNVPKGTESFVLILHDADAHIAKAFGDIPHWVVFNIPGDATSLPEGVPPDAPLENGTLQGNNMMRRAAYQGPCAPPDHPPHHYTFGLYALDKKLDLPQGAGLDDIQKAMDGHVLAGGVYVGVFARAAPPSSPKPLQVQ
jgi:Raf kinase inhibitor-like YbhB/YbcL family protein